MAFPSSGHLQALSTQFTEHLLCVRDFPRHNRIGPPTLAEQETTTPILQMTKPEPRKVVKFAQGPAANKTLIIARMSAFNKSNILCAYSHILPRTSQ